MSTSNRWTLRYVAAIEPSGAISAEVLYGRSGSSLVSAVLPTRIHAPRRRATSAKGACADRGWAALTRGNRRPCRGTGGTRAARPAGRRRGRFVGERDRSRDVGRRRRPGVELDERDRQVHDCILRAVTADPGR